MTANPTWSPNSSIAGYGVIVDSSGNVQQAGGAGGTTGTKAPVWASALGGITQDNTVTWTAVVVLASSASAGALNGLPVPQFVTDSDGLDPKLIVADMIAQFEAASGRTLQPAQVERLLINLYAYRESLVRNGIQWAAQQNLLAYSSFPMIDYLGQLLGVSRINAQPATTILEFTLSATLSQTYTISAGAQVGSFDGAFVFVTAAALPIPAGTMTGTVAAVATNPGSDANGYLPGQINVMITPDVLIKAVTNTTTSSAGSATETDDHLRTRIQAAPNRFSVAGPVGAYRFLAFGVSQSIIDVQVVSPAPGAVSVYVLTGPITTQPSASPNSGGIASSDLLASLQLALSADNVRPLTDTVSVYAVTEVDYQIAGTVSIYSDAEPASIAVAVNAAAQQFAINLASRIQRDIVPSQIIEALSVPGVYQVTLTAPTYTQLPAGSWANCTAINLTQVIGTEHS